MLPGAEADARDQVRDVGAEACQRRRWSRPSSWSRRDAASPARRQRSAVTPARHRCPRGPRERPLDPHGVSMTWRPAGDPGQPDPRVVEPSLGLVADQRRSTAIAHSTPRGLHGPSLSPPTAAAAFHDAGRAAQHSATRYGSAGSRRARPESSGSTLTRAAPDCRSSSSVRWTLWAPSPGRVVRIHATGKAAKARGGVRSASAQVGSDQ